MATFPNKKNKKTMIVQMEYNIKDKKDKYNNKMKQKYKYNSLYIEIPLCNAGEGASNETAG